MRTRTLSLIALGLLILLVGIGASYLKKIAVKQGKDNRWKVAAAFQELDLVFPTSFKLKKGAGSAEPDLALIIKTMNTVHDKAALTRLEKNGGAVEFIPYQPMVYRLDRPDAQWQMVLTYEKESGKIRAEAYGIDPSGPVSTREYPCCRW